MPKSQSERSHTPSLNLPSRKAREPAKEQKFSSRPMVRELGAEEAKKILVELAGGGDEEAKDLLEKFLESHPNPRT